jgi:hypothetical protein
MPLNPAPATIAALRVALRELDTLPDSDHLRGLKQILYRRIAELEQADPPAEAASENRR